MEHFLFTQILNGEKRWKLHLRTVSIAMRITRQPSKILARCQKDGASNFMRSTTAASILYIQANSRFLLELINQVMQNP
ncbi:hypothetical protein Peur_012710 [Populus x canadensis]